MIARLRRRIARWRGRGAHIPHAALGLAVRPCVSCAAPLHTCWPCPRCGRVQPGTEADQATRPPDLETYPPFYIGAWAVERGLDGGVYLSTAKPGPAGILIGAETWAAIVAHVAAGGGAQTGDHG